MIYNTDYCETENPFYDASVYNSSVLSDLRFELSQYNIWMIGRHRKQNEECPLNEWQVKEYIKEVKRLSKWMKDFDASNKAFSKLI